MTKRCEDCDKCPYHDLVMDFIFRLHDAQKPAVKMWQKAHNKPLWWPDPIMLIKWLIKEAK